MATRQWPIHCQHCGKVTLHVQHSQDLNHVLHLLVTVLTCGLWLPVWGIAAIVAEHSDSPWTCMTCGWGIPKKPVINWVQLAIAGAACVVILIAFIAFVAMG